jgi:hypothetical protein
MPPSRVQQRGLLLLLGLVVLLALVRIWWR